MITADHRLVFEPLGEAAWRLCDRVADEGDATRLLAYVERAPRGGYEAIWIGMANPPTRHASRDDVLRTARVLMGAPSTSTRSKPIPIPHRGPIGATRTGGRR